MARRLRSEDVLAALAALFVTLGPPAHIRSDNGPEFIANAVQEWLAKVGVKTLYITPGSPWESGYCESFNGSMRDELLNGEIFCTLAEARILIDAWRLHYNTVRPHRPQGYRPPAPPKARHAAGGNLALTIDTDHSVGAGQEVPVGPFDAAFMHPPRCAPSPSGRFNPIRWITMRNSVTLERWTMLLR